jgi:2'-5' RNA ligase
MTVLAVVAYPGLEAADREWVESIRTKHDPQAARISVHFTLVFPADASPSDVAEEVSAVAGSTGPIPFTIRGARAVPDSLAAGAHALLVPGEGGDEITRLHDRLYEGVLRPHLRVDIPFIPHMTVAAASDLDSCWRLIGELSLNRRTVRGNIGSVELVEVGKFRVESIKRFVLGRPEELT